MARPAILQTLKHGKILCRDVFRFFVETWNWLVGYVDNMKGDADINPAQGHVVIDRTDPDRPVIRLVNLQNQVDDGNKNKDNESDPVVESLNELTGDLTVIGGSKIRVETDEEQKRIKIIYDENATDPDEEEDPTSNHCTHPGNASADGGVPVDGGGSGSDGQTVPGHSSGGGSGDGGANGGVPADNSDTHIGNDGCNCS